MTETRRLANTLTCQDDGGGGGSEQSSSTGEYESHAARKTGASVIRDLEMSTLWGQQQTVNGWHILIFGSIFVYFSCDANLNLR